MILFEYLTHKPISNTILRLTKFDDSISKSVGDSNPASFQHVSPKFLSCRKNAHDWLAGASKYWRGGR